MHPAPSLAESFPKATTNSNSSSSNNNINNNINKSDERDRSHQHQHQHQHQHVSHLHHDPDLDRPQSRHSEHLVHSDPMSAAVLVPPASPPMRKDTASSTSTVASDSTTVITSNSADTSSTAYSVESSQSIFSVKDGAEISGMRRASRRRTGPLSAQQREKAALIRKLGACGDCRRRRVACHPNHHNMTWEDAVRKYRSSSPVQDLAPLAGRPISPAPSHSRTVYSQDPQEMDIDTSPTTPRSQTTPARPTLGDARMRTPLPSGPRLEKPLSMPALTTPTPYASLPSVNTLKTDLESTATRILSSPHRNRYTSVYALLIFWEDDEEPGVVRAVQELGEVFDKYYHFSCDVVKIPRSDACMNPWRWLSRVINDFTDKSDTRDVMKIVYYNGYSFLDDNREMILARQAYARLHRASSIRWSGIKQLLEEACSDTLIIMDSVYYPSSKMVRQKGVLELIAASASEDYFEVFERGSFTRILAEELRIRAAQRLPNALSAAELHSKLLSIYPSIIHDRLREKTAASNTPSPLHLQISGSARLPSITLSPPQLPRTLPSPEPAHGPQLTLSIRLTEESLSLENWTEWFRMMPEGIRDVKVEGPYHTFR
ncbi:hypothetical protein F4780DRAFT_770397 [Xylariomycetidae sp. FL0641]|nr:hypothetical protein F4780DRAFT_770397 [Xylariomycetidae sp. FL0641]